MSIQLLRDSVYNKCEKKLVGFDKIEGTPITQIHNTIRKEFELGLRAIINSFVAELSKHSLLEKKKEIALDFKEEFCSKEFKGIFKHDINYSEEYKIKCIKECEITDPRTSKKFVLEKNHDLSDKSKDFYTVFLGKLGWNSWVEEFSPADFIISAEHNNTDNTIVKRLEIINLPKFLNSVPLLEIENYIPRVSILEEIFNLFEQKCKKININGISGIGKTFLAKHLIQHYSEKFNHIVWLNCSSGITKAFTQGKGVKLLDVMGLTTEYKSYMEGNIDDEGLMSLALGRLQNIKNNSLLVLDNIDEEIYNYEDEIQLPTNWKVLTTSQEKLDGFHNYSIPYFDRESLNLFYKYYTLEKDDDNLIRLLFAIEHHTLTIELLAKTAEQRQLTIIQLVNRFIEKGINVVEKTKVIANHSKERNKTKIENIEEYLNIVFDTSVLSEEECKILLNIAILQSEPIEINLFKEVYLNNTSDNKVIDVFEHNINILSGKGWIQIEKEDIKLHSLLKSIIIKRFIHKNDFVYSTVKYLKKILKLEFSETVLVNVKYLVLCETLLENIFEENEDIIFLKHVVSVFYTEVGLYEKAGKFITDCFKQSVNTEDPIGILVALFNLATISKHNDKHDDALFFFEKLNSLLDGNKKMEFYNDLIDSLTSFFKENTISDLFGLEFQFDSKLLNLATIVNVILEAYSEIIILKDKDIPKKINDLENVILKRQDILDIIENNVTEQLLFSSIIYKKLSLSNTAILKQIGLYYIELGKYYEAELFLNKALEIEKKILRDGHFLLFSIYINFTFLYIENGDLGKASFFLEKSGKICSLLPSNHPYLISYKKHLDTFEKLKHEQFISGNLEKIIQTKFDVLNKRNENYTTIIQYYETLYSAYIEINDMGKANEYISKGIKLLSDTKEIFYKELQQLFILYIKSAVTYIYMNDIDNALQAYNKALILHEEKITSTQSSKQLISNVYTVLTEYAFNTNYISIIETRIREDLIISQRKFRDFISNSILNDNLIIVVEEIFFFLFNLYDLKETLKGVDIYSEKMDVFLIEYDALVNDIIKKSIKTENYINDFYTNKIQYKILDEYFQIIIHLFSKYKNWRVTIQYYYKRIFLNQRCFEEFEKIGLFYHDIGKHYFDSKQFELALETVHNAVDSYRKFLNNQKLDIEISKLTKLHLKDALDLEKMINEELKKFKVLE